MPCPTLEPLGHVQVCMSSLMSSLGRLSGQNERENLLSDDGDVYHGSELHRTETQVAVLRGPASIIITTTTTTTATATAGINGIAGMARLEAT